MTDPGEQPGAGRERGCAGSLGKTGERMKLKWKSLACVLWTVLLAMGAAAPAGPVSKAEESAVEEWTVLEEKAWPELNDAGFLDQGEFVSEDPEEGIWRYCSGTLKIEIIRRTETEPVNLIWYEAEVWSRKETFGFITNVPGKHFSEADWPVNVAVKNGAVLAINGDYASNRWNNMHYPKERYKVGILLRDGEIRSSETKKSGNTSFPNLDTLAIYPDGNMEVHDSRELTAEEYLQRGAVDVLAFGPWLIRDGTVRDNLKRFATNNRNPRTAIGMIEPGHYIAIMVEGRTKQSRGCELTRLAQMMLDRGCRLALNLDGGETSCILFMGKQICTVGNSHSKKGYARKEPEFLAIGISSLVEGYEQEKQTE